MERIHRRIAVLALAWAGLAATPLAASAPSPFRDPYLGNRLAFTVPDRQAGCVADLLGRRDVTCDSAVGPGSRRAPADRPGTPPKPASCSMGWGVRYVLPPRGCPYGRCASTWIGSGHRMLHAGRTLRMGRGIHCRARVNGVVCRNRTGHGFVLTRARVRLF